MADDECDTMCPAILYGCHFGILQLQLLFCDAPLLGLAPLRERECLSLSFFVVVVVVVVVVVILWPCEQANERASQQPNQSVRVDYFNE